MAKKIYTIIGMVLTVSLFVMLCVWGCGENGKNRELKEDIEQIETETEKLRTDAKDLRAENSKLKSELETSEEIIEQIESKYNNLEREHRLFMEIVGDAENISSELGKNTKEFGEENKKFGEDIKELEKLFIEILDN